MTHMGRSPSLMFICQLEMAVAVFRTVDLYRGCSRINEEINICYVNITIAVVQVSVLDLFTVYFILTKTNHHCKFILHLANCW